MIFTILACLAATCAAGKTTIIPGASYRSTAYAPLTIALSPAVGEDELCITHGDDGAARTLALVADSETRCAAGVVFLGAAPSAEAVAASGRRCLVVAASLDGVTRFSQYARLHHEKGPCRLAVIRGASHMSFASGAPATALVSTLDLTPTKSSEEVVATLAALLNDFTGSGDGKALRGAESEMAKMAQPIVDALILEGSEALGTPACNSDFPTNPSCNYPMYPDFALGKRAPAPDPLPPIDCVCGSPWVADHANAIVAGTDFKSFKITAADAFHDVSDTHPFHLPHVWNECPAGGDSSQCTLNMTTLTMKVLKAGELFPDNSSAPLSAFEMKAKVKSRQVTWDAAGLNGTGADDKNMSICRSVNEAAWTWALAHAEQGVREHHAANGLPLVMVDDKEAPIGITGPTWIKKELVYTKMADRVEVQSWAFVVGKSPITSKFIPAGMHYCKLLSPARAMEWIYTDSLRR